MTYKKRIAHLEEQHHMLDKKIERLILEGKFEDNEIHELKKKKLQFKDEIAKLKQLMQEKRHP